jgi:hypothetical protein
MLPSESVKNYVALLKIRHAAYRRNTLILGGFFAVILAAIIITGLPSGEVNRSIYIIFGVLVANGIGLIVTWTRLEITRETLQLLENI